MPDALTHGSAIDLTIAAVFMLFIVATLGCSGYLRLNGQGGLARLASAIAFFIFALGIVFFLE